MGKLLRKWPRSSVIADHGVERCGVLPTVMTKKNKRKSKNAFLRSLIRSRIGFPCPCCGEVMVGEPNHANMATLEHVIPLDHGGTNHPSNLDVICLSCQRVRNSVKIHFDNQRRLVPKEYWQLSLCNSLMYLVEEFYKEYHEIFLQRRYGEVLPIKMN